MNLIKRRSLIIFLCFFSSTVTYAQAWFAVDDFPGVERDDGASFVIGNKAYCGSGVVPFTPLGDFYSLNGATQEWDTIAALPSGEERQYAAAFDYDSLGYLFGGYDGSFLNDLWQYDPIADLWTQKASLPSYGRSGAASFVIDSIAYILGGKSDTLEAVKEVWSYNLISGSWSRKNDLPFGAVWRAAAASNDQFGYLAFGLDDSLNQQSALYRYDPNSDSWSKLSDFSEGGRHYVNMHLLGEQLIMIGGQDSNGSYLNSTWTFRLNSQQWEQLDSLPSEGRRGGMSFQLGGAIYYTTGLLNDRSRSRQTWKLEDPTELFELRQEQEELVNVFPNPTSGPLNIYLSEPNGHSILEIYTLQGKRISSQALSSENLKIDLSNYSNSILILRFWIEGQWMTRKVLVF